MDNTTVAKNSIDELNNRLASVLLPHTITLFVYMMLGLLGNTMVIYIYKFKLRKVSEDRFFIPYLAGIDTMACVICSSANIIINFNYVRYNDKLLCKIFFLLSQFTASSSAFMLTIIAIQRFQLVCRPFKPKMTLKAKRLGVYIMLVVMFLGSTPRLFTTGIEPITNKHLNATGAVCTTVDVMGSRLFPLIYNTLVLASCVGNLFVLCPLYVKICRTLYGRVQYQKTVRMAPGFSSTDNTSGSRMSPVSTVTDLDSVESSCSTAISSLSTHRHTKMKTVGNRFSVMFLIITLMYIVCLIPTLAAMMSRFLTASEGDKWPDESAANLIALRTANTMFIVNNIINPVIYGFLDKKFRNEIKSWFHGIC